MSLLAAYLSSRVVAQVCFCIGVIGDLLLEPSLEAVQQQLHYFRKRESVLQYPA
jgi:hypothetical protein